MLLGPQKLEPRVCGGESTRTIRSVPGGESVTRLRLRLVNLLPLAQRTKTLTHAWYVRRTSTSTIYFVH